MVFQISKNLYVVQVDTNRFVNVLFNKGYAFIKKCSDGANVYDCAGNTYDIRNLDEGKILNAVREYAFGKAA